MTPFEQREAFHVMWFAAFAARFSGRAYALKGGVCLRLFHRSPRLSEDMDLDVGNIALETLRKGVDGVARHPALVGQLASVGIPHFTWRMAKDTSTAQRWVFSLEPGGSAPPIMTRLECSRRRTAIPAIPGVPSADLLDRYGVRPFSGQYYAAEEMVRQKVEALASVRRHALRDAFDLDHLFTHADAALPRECPSQVRAAAIKKLGAMTAREFDADVLPFLPHEIRPVYEGREAFEALVARVQDRLA